MQTSSSQLLIVFYSDLRGERRQGGVVRTQVSVEGVYLVLSIRVKGCSCDRGGCKGDCEGGREVERERGKL